MLEVMMNRMLIPGTMLLAILLLIFPASSPAQTSTPASQPQPWSLKMTAPLETGVVCIDIDQMLAFYVDVLGLKMVADARTTAEISNKFGATPDGYRIVRLQTPNGERVKLVQPNKVASRSNRGSAFVFERQGTAYISFVIADIQDAAKRLKQHGVKLMSTDPVEVRKGVTALFAQDPEGNFVEFVEYADVASYRPDLRK